MTTILERMLRLASGFYNSDDKSAGNPGGLGDDGHSDNLPGLLVDVGLVAQDVGARAASASAARDAVLDAQVAINAANDLAIADMIGIKADAAAMEEQAQNAATSASSSASQAAASAAGLNLPAITGADAGKVLKVKADGSGYETGQVGGSPFSGSAAKSAAYTILAADAGTLFYVTGATKLTLSAAATLGVGWWGGVANSGSAMVSLASSDPINGSAGGIRLSPGDAVLLHCDGQRLFAIGQKAAGISGYVMGGTSGSYLSSIEKYSILANAMATTAAALSAARQECVGVNSDANGYAMGGYAGSAVAEIDGIKFSSDAAINPSAVLAKSHAGRGGVNSATSGYVMGGYTASANPTTEIQGFAFATEAATDPAAVLSAGRSRPGYVNSATKGYACAGESSSTVVDGVVFATETAFTGANAISTRDASTGVNSASAGYLMSGNGLTSTAKLVFSTDATSTLADTLATNRASALGFNDDVGGFAWGNGSSATSGSRLDFATEASAAVSVLLATGRQAGASVQSGGIL